MRMVLFDIDGTLLLSTKTAEDALTEAFQELFGAEADLKSVERHGRTDPAIFLEVARAALGRTLEREELFLLLDRYGALFEEAIDLAEEFEVLDGVHQLCHALMADTELVMGIQTGNIRSVALGKLRRAGLEHFFSFGGYGSDSEERSELQRIAVRRARQLFPEHSFASEEVIVIGDSRSDMTAARENNFLPVGVATGRTSARDLSASGAEITLDSFAYSKPLIELIKTP